MLVVRQVFKYNILKSNMEDFYIKEKKNGGGALL